MNYGKKKKERERAEKRQGNLYFALAIVIAIALGALFFYTKTSREGINEKGDLCPESGPKGYWAIVLDTTDALSETQKIWVRKYFNEVVINSIPKFYQVSLYSTTSTANSTAVLQKVRICNPGDGSDKSIWIDAPKKALKRFEDKFTEPVSEWLEQELTGETSDESPLMKYLSEISVTAFPIERDNLNLKLIIVSDMLENTPEYSHYRSKPDFEWAKNQPFHTQLSPHLEKVEVHLIYVKRPGVESIQKQSHLDFWRDFFGFHKARVTQVDPI